MLDRIDSYRWLIVAILIVPVIAGVAILWADHLGDNTQPLVLEDGAASEADIRVYVTGAVANPGVYALEPSLRWIDALDAAGGPTSEADLEGINLATRINDEDMIVIPRVGSVSTSGRGDADDVSVVLNINTASKQELDTLPGIGEVRAGRIVASRESDGLFTAIEDLLVRELIPDSVFEEIASLISVN